MKYLKHILLCCSFFILLLCLIPAQAQASKYTYNIEKYDVSIRGYPTKHIRDYGKTYGEF